MIFLALILPIVIYFFVVKYFFNQLYTGTNKKLRRIIFIGLITLPFWDHIIGYTIYRTLCFVNGGTTIYKTVTDEQEQRDYWFRDNVSQGIFAKKLYTQKDIIVNNLKVPFSKKLVFKTKDKTVKA